MWARLKHGVILLGEDNSKKQFRVLEESQILLECTESASDTTNDGVASFLEFLQS